VTRNETIFALWRDGIRQSTIAQHFGISQTRVQEIIAMPERKRLRAERRAQATQFHRWNVAEDVAGFWLNRQAPLGQRGRANYLHGG
jgi:hypothetical protein